jgi:sodium/hydrogen antiporter
MLPGARWRPSAAVLALALGAAIGGPGLRLVQPRLLQDGGLIEPISQLALLICLFCAGLRLQVPFEWRRWGIPLRLSTLTMLATAALAAAVGMILFEVNFLEALLLAAILAPTDAALASDGHPATEGDSFASETLAAEGALSGAFAVPFVAFVLALLGGEENGPASWLLLAWSWGGGIAIGWLIGLAMARWIQILDFDRQTDVLELIVVFATGALAYGAAEVVHASGFPAVLTAGIALCHAGKLRSPMRQRALAPRVIKIASRVERWAALAMIVLLGAVSSDMAFGLKTLAFGLLLLGFVRPLAVRLGLNLWPTPGSPAQALSAAQRKPIEWLGVRGAAALYCLVFAINRVGSPLARELAGIVLLVIAGSIVAHNLSATPVQRPSPGEPGALSS